MTSLLPAGVMLACLPVLLHARQDTTAVSDSTLLKQIEQQMAPAPAAQPAQPRSAISTNPNISVIGDFQGSYRSDADRHVDAYLNEAEFSYQSIIDPYARADFFVSLGRDPSTGKIEPDLEEAYVTTLELPYDLQLKAGKFRMALGRVNPVHPHALPFIDLPDVYRAYLGDEGLKDEGLSLSWLLPNPGFYQELTLEATAGPTDAASFARSGSSRYLYLAHLKNFWDLTENATLELGISGLTGPNDSLSTSTIGAFDITYKWKPLRYNTYQSFVWQTEALFTHAGESPTSAVSSWGMYSAATFQVEKRWFLTGRFDYTEFPFSPDLQEHAFSATLGWYATEFQKIELEAKTTSGNVRDPFSQALLRWIFVIGSHGAHQY